MQRILNYNQTVFLQKKTEFLQKCLWLTLETMSDIDIHILIELLQVRNVLNNNNKIIKMYLQKHKTSFPNLHRQIINYKHTIRYLQKQIFDKKKLIPKVIQALNHWFTVMVSSKVF